MVSACRRVILVKHPQSVSLYVVRAVVACLHHDGLAALPDCLAADESASSRLHGLTGGGDWNQTGGAPSPLVPTRHVHTGASEESQTPLLFSTIPLCVTQTQATQRVLAAAQWQRPAEASNVPQQTPEPGNTRRSHDDPSRPPPPTGRLTHTLKRQAPPHASNRQQHNNSHSALPLLTQEKGKQSTQAERNKRNGIECSSALAAVDPHARPLVRAAPRSPAAPKRPCALALRHEKGYSTASPQRRRVTGAPGVRDAIASWINCVVLTTPTASRVGAAAAG